MSIITAGPTLASTTPPWQVAGSQDSHQAGSLTFYNSTGGVVTSGTLETAPIAAYAVASTPDSSHTTAQMDIYEPIAGALPSTWSGANLSANTVYPVTSGPTVVTGAGEDPVATGSSSDIPIGYYINNNDDSGATTAGYAHVYEIRVKTGTSTYWAADIQVNITGTTNEGGNIVDTGTWTQIWPTPQLTTGTVLTGSPATSAAQGQTVHLTATVTASDSSAPTGSVQFKDGSANLGSPVSLTAGTGHSTATMSWSSSTVGSHSLSAVYTPSSGSAYTGSTGNLTYSVTYAAPQWLPDLYGTVRVGSTVWCLASFNYGTPAWSWHQGTTLLATTQSYTIPSAEYGKQITCSVTDTNGTHQVSGTSKAATVAIGPALVVVSKPYLHNTNSGGKVLHGTYEYVTNGTWSPAASSYTYQWYVGSTAITGATAYRYLIPSGDVGKSISCVVVAHLSGYTNGSYHTPAALVSG